VTRRDPLAAHIRRLGNHDLNELLVQLAKPTFAALVDVALVRPGCCCATSGPTAWTAGRWWPAPRRRLGALTRDHDPNGQPAWRAWTRAGDPVQITGIFWWRRRGDAAAALAWVTPASRARWLALAAHVRTLTDTQLHELLRALPCAVFDGLLEAAFASEGTAA
jgi:hypothetical protein